MPDQPRRSRGWRIAAPMVLALCGVLLVASAEASDGDDLRGSDVLELSDLVRAEERRTLELGAEVEALAAQVDQLSSGLDDARTKQLQEQVDRLEDAAGLTPVEGPGLSVTLADSPIIEDDQPLAPGTIIEDYIVHQEDLEGVINALWAGGAEAMTVMGERITTRSTVRCVGPSLRVDGRLYYPPYKIAAIGDVDKIEDALDESPAVQNYRFAVDYLDLGYQVVEHESITMPGYDGTIVTGSAS